ncbi:MAG: energy-coupling factor transporter transmembrane protein EcfT [Clostridia bacterium]|nr:energy-coupling factor transporter transmembrane protein EcfT [Clostridia bacterium]
MLKDITFGQYIERNSPLHRMDPLAKLMLLILMIVFLFLSNGFAGLTLFVALLVTGIALSKIPLKMFLRNLKAIWVILVFTALINLFYGSGGVLLISFWKIHIYSEGVKRAVFMAFRIMLLIMLSSLLTYTTTPNDLTDGIESLLSPLRFIGLKNAVHTLAMMMTIALRFIPTLVEETEKIMNAQKARGADLEEGKLLERIRALIPILIPLLISSIRRAYELAEAMECRCYNGGEGRVRMKQLHYSVNDLISAICCIAACVGIIFANHYISF